MRDARGRFAVVVFQCPTAQHGISNVQVRALSRDSSSMVLPLFGWMFRVGLDILRPAFGWKHRPSIQSLDRIRVIRAIRCLGRSSFRVFGVVRGFLILDFDSDDRVRVRERSSRIPHLASLFPSA